MPRSTPAASAVSQLRSAAAAPAAAGGWLWSPAADLLIGCGGWTLPLLLLTAWLSGQAAVEVAVGFALLALVCNQPHYAATLVRAFGSAEARRAHRLHAVPLSLLFAALLIAAFVYAPLVPLLFTAYVLWSPWHYTGQNFGLVLLLARRRDAPPLAAERTLLRCGFVAAYGVWLLTVLGQPSSDPYLWSLDALSPRAGTALSAVADPAALFLAILFAVATGTALGRIGARAGWRAVAPAALLSSTQGLWFVAPWLLQVVAGHSVSPLYYATGALAFMHCAQYLWLTSFTARRGARRRVDWRPWRYAGGLVLIGIALFSTGPWLASALGGVDLRESTLLFVALVNLHHFIVDGAVWKLREPRVAALLLEAAPGARPAPAAAPRPVAAARARHPALRWSAAAALLALAALSALQHVLTLPDAGAERLALAGWLNPHDTRVDVRRAELLAESGDAEGALRILARHAEARPANAAALRLTGSLLVATGRLDEARAHYARVRDSVGLDARGWVNLGVLAARDGRLDDAAAALRAALRLDPGLAAAHLNLAGVCAQRGELACALAEYDAFLSDPAVPRDATWTRAALNAAAAADAARRPQLARVLRDAAAGVTAQLARQP